MKGRGSVRVEGTMEQKVKVIIIYVQIFIVKQLGIIKMC